MDAAAIVLAGGRSSRMGTPKAALDWHGRPLLVHTVEILAAAVSGPLIVVRAPDQELPPLPAGVEVVADPVAGRGPLQGIAAGLAAVGARRDAAFVASVDLPFLVPAYVHRVLAGLADPEVDIVLPRVHGYRQPLAAAYRPALAPLIEQLLAAGETKPPSLFAACRVYMLDETELLADPVLAEADPTLASVTNVNTPEDYTDAIEGGRPTLGG